MKRTIALIALIIFTASSSAFAEKITVGSGAEYSATTPVPAKLGKLSTKVDATINTVTNTYAAITKHVNGTKCFGSSAGDTRIYSKATGCEDGKTAASLSFSKSDSSDFTSGNNWTSL